MIDFRGFKKVLKAFILIVCVSVTFTPSFSIYSKEEMEIFEFLRIPNDAKCASLSGCTIGMIGNPFAIFANPAALQTDVKVAGATYFRYVADIQGGCGVYVIPALGGTFGTGISYWNYGAIPKMDKHRKELGTFTPQSLTPIVGYSKNLKGSQIGVSSKIIYQSIDEYMGLAVAGDIGYLFYPKAYPNIIVGMTIQNVGMKLRKFYTFYENLPMFARIGCTYSFNKLLQLSAEVELPEIELILGVEWKVSKILAIRGGYYSWGRDLRVGGDLDIFAGKSLGIGIKTQRLHLDYAVTPMVNLGIVHRISIVYPFEKVKEEPKPEEKLKPEELEEKIPEEKSPEEGSNLE